MLFVALLLPNNKNPERNRFDHINVRLKKNMLIKCFFLMFLERAGQNNQWLFFFEVGLRSSAGDF